MDMPKPIATLPRLPHSGVRSCVGAMLLETVMAMAIIAIFLTGQYTANMHVWRLLRESLESNGASRVLNGRAEQIRAATWDQITDANFLATSVLSIAPDVADELGELTETIDVIAYPTPSPNPSALKVTRDKNTGIVTIVAAGDGTMNAQPSIRVNLTENWKAKGGRSRMKQISMIISNGGVTGRR